MTDDNSKTDDTGARVKARTIKRKALYKRESSGILFPYRDLETAISVAQGMLKAGGVALTNDQLAGALNLASGTGHFVLKIATARIFGLVINQGGKYELTTLGFSIVDNDEKRQRVARAEAFLNVPLYKRTYEEFRGKQLPPRPHGLEQAFVKFGVSPKQKSNARLAFDKSAQQAGFFSAGDDRLIEPITTSVSQTEAAPGSVHAASAHLGRRSLQGAYHPFIQGLLDTLPEPNTNWAIEGRTKWLQAAAHNFDLIYKGSGEINIAYVTDKEEIGKV